MSEDDILKEFLKGHDSNNYDKPFYEFTQIQKKILPKKNTWFPILIPSSVLALALVALLILKTDNRQKELSDDELAQFISESYDYLDSNSFEKVDDYLSLIQ